MPQTILSVDGNAAVRGARNGILREAGFEVIEAGNGSDALKLASEERPALVVLVIESPGIDGLAICRRLKADPRTASIPALHIAGPGEPYRGYPESLESGADAWLQEPLDPPVLVAAAQALIRARSGGAGTTKAEGDAPSDGRLSALIDSIPDEVWFADTQHKFTLANPSALREFKMGAPTLVDVEEMARSLEVFRADGSPRPVEEAPPLRALRGEAVREQEEIVRTPVHGELRFRQVSASPVRDAAGNIVGSVSVVRDITERRRAEQARRASEERYWTLFETMTEGFALHEIVCDAAGKPCDFRYLAINPAFERQTGLKAENLLGRTYRESFQGADPLWLETYGKVALTGESARFEAWFGPLGRWYEVSAFQNEPGGFGVIFTDITERKRAEEERQSLAGELANRVGELQAILDAAPVAIWIAHDPQCLRITGNAFADRVVTQTERGGNSSRSALPGDAAVAFRTFRGGVELQPEELPAQLAAATAQPVKQDEIDMVFPGGRTVHMLLGAVPLFDAEGRVRGSVVAGVDVTWRKRAEEALRESEAKYRTLFDTLIEGFCIIEVVFDADGKPVDYRFLEINPAFEAQTGLKNARGRLMREMAPDHEAHWFEIYGRVAATGQPARFVNEAKALHRWYDVSAYRVGGPESRKVALLFNDITERVRAEARLRDAQKLESLGLLAGGVAHDFNNLLVGVIGNASLAQDMLPPGNPAVELIERVIKTGEQAAHLTRQMLAYSGKGRFLVEPLDLSALIPEMSGLVQPSISKKIALHLDLRDDLPSIEADRGQVQQVFMNLTLNAAEAIGSHEGVIAVRTGVQDVDERFVQLHPEAAALGSGRHVFLEVRDTGCGMDDAVRAKLFDPFFSTKFTGRGLGLAAVAGIVRGHKGAITVDSAPGKGSCFTVLFPAAACAGAGAPAAARDAALQGSGVVLVVDDEPVVRDMARIALERHGYTVLLADSGLAAIDMFKRYPGEIALVVLDLSMPRMNGEEALPELRKIRPQVKALISSGYSESETMALFRGQRVSGFIQKPYTSKGISEKVKSCLA